MGDVETCQCIIRHVNPNGTYRVEFMNVSEHHLHDLFCEAWLSAFGASQSEKQQDDEKRSVISRHSWLEPKLPLLLEIDYDRVLLWKPQLVAHWLVKCGVSTAAADIVKANNVNGVFLFDLDMECLNEMGIAKTECIHILRYMRALRSKLQFDVDSASDDEDEQMIARISMEIQQFDAQIRKLGKEKEAIQMKFDVLVKGNGEEYNRYKDGH